jgi:hypothetical protein
MIRKVVLVAAAVAAAAVIVPWAGGVRPTREPAPFPDFSGRFCPGFDVLVHAVVNREILTTFGDGRVLITGTFKVALTNLATGKTVTVNASGPAFISSDSTTGTFRGRTLIVAEAGTFGPGTPAEVTLLSGVLAVDFTTNTLTSRQGSAEDLCAVLADP